MSSTVDAEKFLRIYMNDQLALGVLWREVARRSARSNQGSELGDALVAVSRAIAEDVSTFESIMERLDIPKNRPKLVAATITERLARLKLNGRLRAYSPLSRFIELEFLSMGIDGKKLLWTTLRDLADLQARLPDIDFDHLVQRAEQQRRKLEPHRAAAGLYAFRP